MHKNAIDLTGNKIGLLLVKSPYKREKGGNIIWECFCDCGKTIYRTAGYLHRIDRIQMRKSCGCSRKGTRSIRYKGCGDLSGQKWANIKGSARRRGYAFTISIEEAWGLFLVQNKKCVFTGMELTLCPNDMKAGANTASLDRINSHMGYISGNVQWVHTIINSMKQTMSDKDFINWCQAVTMYAFGAEFGLGTKENPHYY